MFKIKLSILFISLVFLSAACGLGKGTASGVIKTVNGGADWQFFNKIEEGSAGNLTASQISKLKFDPQNREMVYAGTYNQGLFRSQNSGENWKVILSKLSVYDFALDPFDSNIIYAAGSFSDFGKVLKTEDGGASWQEIYNEASKQNSVRAIAINPGNPNQLIIGTSSGNLIKSLDGGLSWQLVKNFEDRINRLFWQGGEVYVLLRDKGLFRASSAMDNFDYLTESLARNLSVGGINFDKPEVERFNQAYIDEFSGNLLYLATNIGIYKSVDRGVSWQQMALPVKGSASDTWTITVSKSSSNLVFTNVGATIYKSTDGAVSWQTQSIATAGLINYILIDPELSQIVYAGIYIPD